MTLFQKIAFHWQYWRKQPCPLRAVAAHLLAKAHLSTYFSYHRNGVSIRLREAGLARLLWVEPARICEGERFLGQFLRRGDVFVDVGANIGVLTLLAARKVGTEGKVIALEPHPKTFVALQKNLRINRASTVDVVNCAVGAEAGIVRLSDRPDDDWNRVDAETGTIEVEVRKLDDVCRGIGPVKALKIDVEGFELPVLRGAAELLKRTACLVLECWEDHTMRYAYTAEELLDFVIGSGFAGFQLIESVDCVLLKEIGRHHCPNGLENWVFVRDIESLERAGLNVIRSSEQRDGAFRRED